jgi:hypothetical protein
LDTTCKGTGLPSLDLDSIFSGSQVETEKFSDGKNHPSNQGDRIDFKSGSDVNFKKRNMSHTESPCKKPNLEPAEGIVSNTEKGREEVSGDVQSEQNFETKDVDDTQLGLDLMADLKDQFMENAEKEAESEQKDEIQSSDSNEDAEISTKSGLQDDELDDNVYKCYEDIEEWSSIKNFGSTPLLNPSYCPSSYLSISTIVTRTLRSLAKY